MAQSRKNIFSEVYDDLTGILLSERRDINVRNVVWAVFGLDAFIILFLFRIRKLCARWRVPVVGRVLRGVSLSLYGIELGIDIE